MHINISEASERGLPRVKGRASLWPAALCQPARSAILARRREAQRGENGPARESPGFIITV